METNAGSVEHADAATPTTTTKAKSTSPWVALGALSIAGSLALGLLNVLGVGTGPVVNVVTALLLVAAFVVALVNALGDELRDASTRTRRVYVALAALAVVILLIAGLLTRTVAPLHRMRGTTDVAVIGYQAPTAALQQDFDDVSNSLADTLGLNHEAKVFDYSGIVDPPLQQLATPSQAGKLDRWLAEFLTETDAELVIAGYGTQSSTGQLAVHTYVYVPTRMTADASELSGWVLLDSSLADRTLDSNRARRTLMGRITGQLGEVTAFLAGLDDWQAGYATEAVAAFDRVISKAGARPVSTLVDLARLFKGHALETRSESASSAERARWLSAAHNEYRAVPSTSTVHERARLSAATNQYLVASQRGCRPSSVKPSELVRISRALATIAVDVNLAEIIRLKARVNQAQVELCQLRSGDRSAATRLDHILPALTTLALVEEDENSGAKQQIKALALSVRAIRLASASSYDDAIGTIAAALALDSRFERQALWLGLQSSWLLSVCRLDAGAAAQAESLTQLRAAVVEDRLPAALPEQYANAFQVDLQRSRLRCATAPPKGR